MPTPRLVRLDLERQHRFQRLYAAEDACVRAWRLWGWWKTAVAIVGWLVAR